MRNESAVYRPNPNISHQDKTFKKRYKKNIFKCSQPKLPKFHTQVKKNNPVYLAETTDSHELNHNSAFSINCILADISILSKTNTSKRRNFPDEVAD